jgi:hypothetical protein
MVTYSTRRAHVCLYPKLAQAFGQFGHPVISHCVRRSSAPQLNVDLSSIAVVSMHCGIYEWLQTADVLPTSSPRGPERWNVGRHPAKCSVGKHVRTSFSGGCRKLSQLTLLGCLQS